MKVTVRGPVTHRCPYVHELDQGRAELVFDVPTGDAPELHDLADKLGASAAARVSHEEFTRALLANTGAERVITYWETAGLDITVEAP